MRQCAVQPVHLFFRCGLGLCLGWSLWLAPVAAQEGVEPAATETTVGLHYDIQVQLEADGHALRGQMVVEWHNNQPQATQELRWHVYNNAWEGMQSLWMREAQLQQYERSPKTWGHTEVDSVRVLQITDGQHQNLLTAPTAVEFQYLPQVGAPLDRTVAKTSLPVAVVPGGFVQVQLQFRATLPQAFRRNGWGSGGYFHAAQWFPKLGVWEGQGEQVHWNCPPYRFLSEFYADFANYKVAVTLPASYAGHFVASGTVLGSAPAQNEDGTITYFTEAERIHDYAWTVDPKAIVYEREFRAENYRDEAEEQLVAEALGKTVEAVRPQPTRMILLLQPEHEALQDRYFEALGKALYYFGLWYGSYPYPTISCVDPANDARWTGGMEYPRLITAGAHLGVSAKTLSPEGVTVHELGHQFWYGLVANDEFQYAWMDEGFNTFSTLRVLQHAYPDESDTYTVFGAEYEGHAPLSQPQYQSGDPRSFVHLERWQKPDMGMATAFGLHFVHQEDFGRFLAELPPLSYVPRVSHDVVLDARQQMVSAWGQPLSVPTMDLLDYETMRRNAYYRPALTLETMARIMGEVRWLQVLRAYHQRFRFRHPQPGDFLQVVQEFASDVRLEGENGSFAVDWGEFWRQAYDGNDTMDFAVVYLRNLEQTSSAEAESTGPYQVELALSRRGGFHLPVEVRITWEDGSQSQLVWPGKQWSWRYRWQDAPQRALRVEVDPDHHLLLDQNWLNNRLQLQPEADAHWDAGLRALLWAQQVLHYFGGVG